MKKILLFLLFVISFAFGQDTNLYKHKIYFNTGFAKTWAPKEYKNFWHSGFNMSTGYGQQIFSRLELQAMVNYDRFDLDKNGYAYDSEFAQSITNDSTLYMSAEGGISNVFSAFINAKILYPPESQSPFLPYLLLGAGITRLSTDEITVRSLVNSGTLAKKTENVFSTSVGLGVDYYTGSNTNITFQLRFDIAHGENTTVTMPLIMGVIVNL